MTLCAVIHHLFYNDSLISVGEKRLCIHNNNNNNNNNNPGNIWFTPVSMSWGMFVCTCIYTCRLVWSPQPLVLTKPYHLLPVIPSAPKPKQTTWTHLGLSQVWLLCITGVWVHQTGPWSMLSFRWPHRTPLLYPTARQTRLWTLVWSGTREPARLRYIMDEDGVYDYADLL